MSGKEFIVTIRRLLDVDEIIRLRARYCHLLDHKDWDGFAELFAADAVLRTGLAGGPEVVERRGRTAIAEFVRERMGSAASSHQVSAPDIQVLAEDRAQGTWAVHYLQEGNRLTGYGFYHDEYVKQDGRWLIQRVTLETTIRFGTLVSLNPVPSGAEQ